MKRKWVYALPSEKNVSPGDYLVCVKDGKEILVPIIFAHDAGVHARENGRGGCSYIKHFDRAIILKTSGVVLAGIEKNILLEDLLEQRQNNQ